MSTVILTVMDLSKGTMIGAGRYEVKHRRDDRATPSSRNRYTVYDTILEQEAILEIGPEGDTALLDQARVSAKIGDHPSIVRVYDAGTHDGHPYIICSGSGQSLAALVSVPAHITAEVSHTVTAALDHAHAHGAAHGNLSIASVWLDRDDVRVGGFHVVAATEEEIANDRAAAARLITEAGGGPDAPILGSDGTANDYVGRQAETVLLSQALRSAVNGSGQVVMLSGGPGIGKTRTAQEFAQYAQSRGATVVWGRALDADTTPSYWPWVESIRSYSSQTDDDQDARQIMDFLTKVDRAPTGLSVAVDYDSPRSVRFAQFETVSTFLAVAASKSPLVMILDDLHDADETSLELLGFVSRQLGQSRILLLGTYRDTELRRGHPLQRILAELRREPWYSWSNLKGLTMADVEAFISKTAAKAPKGLVDAVYTQTEGNPLFVKEMVGLLHREGVLDDSTEEPRTLDIPEGIRETIGARLDQLSRSTNEMLGLAAIIGTRFRVSELRLLATTEDSVLSALDEALAHGTIREVSEEPGTFAFHHSLVREVLYDEFTAIRRAQLHLQLAESIEEAYADNLTPHLPRLAENYRAALSAGGAAKAVAYAQSAGRHAMEMLAFEEAQRYFSNALETIDFAGAADPRTRIELLHGLAEAKIGLHDIGAVWNILSEVFTLAEGPELAHLRARAAVTAETTMAFSGRLEVRPVLKMLEQCEREIPPEQKEIRAPAIASLARALLQAGQLEAAREWANRAIELAREVDAIDSADVALHVKIQTLLHPSKLEERIQAANEYIRANRSATDSPEAMYSSRLKLTYGIGQRLVMRMERGDREGYLQDYDETMSALRSPRPFVTYATGLHQVCRHLLEGHYDEAERIARETYERGTRTSISSVEGVYGLQMFTITRDLGRLGTVRPILEQFLADSSRNPWLAGLAMLYAELNMSDHARATFEKLAHNDFEPIKYDSGWAGSMAYVAEVCAYLEDDTSAARLHEILLAYADVLIVLGGVVVCLGSGSRFLGLLSAVQHKWREAEGHFERAIDMNQSFRVIPALIRTRRDYASMLLKRRRGNDVSKALELAETALSQAKSIGMAGVIDELEAVASSALAHSGKQATYPDGLTPREMEVLLLIAEGCTNAEIAGELTISERTVHSHVSKVLSKTGCLNRAEAASYAIRKHLA